MSTATTAPPIRREPELLGQTVVVIGSSAGIGLETARRARAEGARLILTGRNPQRLQRAASVVEALSTASFDATDPAPLERFFRDLPATIDHVAALAVHIMVNTALTGATYDVDGGQQLVAAS